MSNASDVFASGYSAFEKGRYDEAISHYSRYLELNNDPNDTDYKSARGNLRLAYYNLGLVSYQKEDYRSAQSYFQSALIIDERDEKTLYFLGLSQMSNNDLDGALQSFRK